MAPARILALLAALLPLAGCIGTEEPAEFPAARPAPQTQEDVDPVPQAVEDVTPPNASAPVAYTTTLAWDGRLAPEACAPTGVDACTGPSLVAGDDVFEVEVPGRPRAAAFTLTWTPSTPLTKELVFGIYAVRACGEGCREFSILGEPVTGASPLALEVSVPPLAEGDSIALVVQGTRATPSPVYASARAEQPFHAEGNITSTA